MQFRPTFVMSDEETATLRQSVAAADVQYINAGVLRPNEVALARFGRPDFSLDTTLIDREADGSIKEEEQDLSQVQFGGDFGQGQGEEGQEGAAAADPAAPAPDGAQLAPPRPTADGADGEACCEACAREEPCEEGCDGNACAKEKEDEQPDDPEQHDHPDQVGQVMHRWKHGTLHSGTGRKGEHRGEVGYPKGRKQAIAIALSIAGKSKPRRRAGRHRTVREDAWQLPARVQVAGVVVDVGPDGTGAMLGPYGTPTPTRPSSARTAPASGR